MRRELRNPLPLIRWAFYALMVTVSFARPGLAQDLTPSTEPPARDSAPERPGVVDEPAVIRRAVVIFDRRINFGEVTEGPYTVYGKMIPGGGWISGGLGYRRWYAHDRAFLDASAQGSWRGYTTAQARFELPRLARSRLLVGVQARWQDFKQVDFFGEGPDSFVASRSQYRIQSRVAGGYVTVRPIRTLALNTQLGWLLPSILAPAGAFQRGFPDARDLFTANAVFAFSEQPTFFHREISITSDTRDFPGHPTSGGTYRAVFASYGDRRTAAFNFKRYEAEAARFVMVPGAGVVLAVRGWLVASDAAEGQTVPFYFQPSLGGANNLRGFTDYRFHDRNLLLVNAEARVPMMTHVDAAAFVDLGNVAPHLGDVDLRKHSFGAGLRLHSRRQTFARVDIATGAEGWQFLVRLTEPLDLSRLSRQTLTAPFVP
jgi:hypothetical protein